MRRIGHCATMAMGACRVSLQDLILECHAIGVIFLEPSVRSFFVRKNFEMAGVANMMSGIDIDPNGCRWSLLSFRFPQCVSLRDESNSARRSGSMLS
jgi:hypothetical protein